MNEKKLISNVNDLNKYKEYNKIYIPENYNKNTYDYYINGNNIRIITNNNCYTQYNTTYCDIYEYNIENNLISRTYNGNANPNLIEIDRQYITSDINYSNHIRQVYIQDKLTFLAIIGIGIIFAILVSKEMRLR